MCPVAFEEMKDFACDMWIVNVPKKYRFMSFSSLIEP